jgi:hypothetical protein
MHGFRRVALIARRTTALLRSNIVGSIVSCEATVECLFFQPSREEHGRLEERFTHLREHRPSSGDSAAAGWSTPRLDVPGRDVLNTNSIPRGVSWSWVDSCAFRIMERCGRQRCVGVDERPWRGNDQQEGDETNLERSLRQIGSNYPCFMPGRTRRAQGRWRGPMRLR